MRRPLLDIVDDATVRWRLEAAFETLRRLPASQHPQGFRMMHCVGSADAKDRGKRPSLRPTGLEISQMDEALGWLEHLRHEDERIRRAVHLRASGLSLRQIAPKLGCSFVWAGRLEARGVAVIVAALRKLDLMPGMSTCARTREKSNRLCRVLSK